MTCTVSIIHTSLALGSQVEVYGRSEVRLFPDILPGLDLVFETILEQANRIHRTMNPTPSVAHILSLPNKLALNPNTFVVSKVVRAPFSVRVSSAATHTAAV